MNISEYDYQSDFGRQLIGQGEARGQVAMLVKLLTLRFGPLADADQARLRSAKEAQLDSVAECILTAQTLAEALGPSSSLGASR